VKVKMSTSEVVEKKKKMLAVRGNKQKEGYEGWSCPASLTRHRKILIICQKNQSPLKMIWGVIL